MTKESDILERLTVLEIEVRHVKENNAKLEKLRAGDAAKFQKQIDDQEIKLAYYDKMALRWGGFLIGVVVCGAFITGKTDKLRDKLIGWFF